jgi:hypothetical protein
VKANVLFRGVQVPKGKYVLRFEFRPLRGAIAELSDELFDDKLPAKR